MRTVPTFDNPQEVLDFVRACLRDSDMERLYAAVLEGCSPFWAKHIFEDLRAIDETKGLEAVFLRDSFFPSSGSSYSFGGCSVRTKHLNFDLICDQGVWRLKKIWKCR